MLNLVCRSLLSLLDLAPHKRHDPLPKSNLTTVLNGYMKFSQMNPTLPAASEAFFEALASCYLFCEGHRSLRDR